MGANKHSNISLGDNVAHDTMSMFVTCRQSRDTVAELWQYSANSAA